MPAPVVVSKEEQHSHGARVYGLDAYAYITSAAQTGATEFNYADRSRRTRGEPFLDLET
jgi:hypothetical protein